MMKKTITVLLIATLALGLTACAGIGGNDKKEPEKPYEEMSFEEKRDLSENVLSDMWDKLEILFTTQTWTIEKEILPNVFTKWFNVDCITADDVETASFQAGCFGEPFGMALVTLKSSFKDAPNIEEIAQDLQDNIYIERWDSEGANLKLAHTVNGNCIFIAMVGEEYEYLFTAEEVVERYLEVYGK